MMNFEVCTTIEPSRRESCSPAIFHSALLMTFSTLPFSQCAVLGYHRAAAPFHDFLCEVRPFLLVDHCSDKTIYIDFVNFVYSKNP